MEEKSTIKAKELKAIEINFIDSENRRREINGSDAIEQSTFVPSFCKQLLTAILLLFYLYVFDKNLIARVCL